MTCVGGEKGFHVQLVAIRFEMWLHALKARTPGGWKPELRLLGVEHIENALREGRGAVLWISQLGPHQLPQKMAFHAHGYSLHHLSTRDHPLSGTRFGMRFLNPVINGVEEKFLAERLVLGQQESGGADAALRALRRRLAANQLISITAAETARNLESLPFFRGRLWLPTGPAALAMAAGAPLLPVFTVQRSGNSFDICVEAALTAATNGERSAAIKDALRKYVARLEEYVQMYPRSWAGPLSAGFLDEDINVQTALVEMKDPASEVAS